MLYVTSIFGGIILRSNKRQRSPFLSSSERCRSFIGINDNNASCNEGCSTRSAPSPVVGGDAQRGIPTQGPEPP